MLLIILLKDKSLTTKQTDANKEKIRDILKNLSAEDFFKYYAQRASYENLPLLTADGIVIPEIGLKSALSKNELINKGPNYCWF